VKWIDAGPTADLHSGEAISIPVDRRMIAVVRSGDEYFAIEDVCTHDGAELTGGEVEGAEIICPMAHASACAPGKRYRRRLTSRYGFSKPKLPTGDCGYAQADSASAWPGTGCG
jgi:hypothetical protein